MKLPDQAMRRPLADAPIAKVIKKFVKRETRRFVVTGQDGVLVGETCGFDLLRVIGEHVDSKLFSRRRT